jgi:hypothetical protein
MTPKEIEDKAQYWATECFNEENWGNHKHSYITGALSRQPEIDQLKQRVKELEELVLDWIPLDQSNPPEEEVLLLTSSKVISKGVWWKNQANIYGFRTEQSQWRFYPPEGIEAVSVLEPKDVLLLAKIPTPTAKQLLTNKPNNNG